MGAFFTNIQLKTSSFDKGEITEKVIECITKINAEAGFIKVDNEEDADKSVIVSTQYSDWLSIYDEEMEEHGPRKLNKLSAELSKEFKTAALSILVHDSDSLYVGLNKNGVLKDSISNLSKEIDFNKSKPSAWSDILLDNFSFDDIKIAWENKSVFVEEFLTDFAKIIGLDTSKLLTGYEYLVEEKTNEGIKLNFAQKDKKKLAELGLTKFSLISGSGILDMHRGEKQDIEWMLTNLGTFSTGLDIVIAGKCIVEGLLIPEIAKVSHYKYKSEKQSEFTVPFVETIATTGEKIFYARISEIYIPKGFQPTYPMTPKEGKRYSKIWYDSAINFNISFIGGEEGKGDFKIYFCPLVNRHEGSYIATLMKGTIQDWIKKNTY